MSGKIETACLRYDLQGNAVLVALFYDFCQARLSRCVNPRDFPSCMETVRPANNSRFYKDVAELLSAAKGEEHDRFVPDGHRAISRGAPAGLRKIPDSSIGPYGFTGVREGALHGSS